MRLSGLLLLFLVNTTAQGQVIRGVVTDSELGMPIPGAVVIWKDSLRQVNTVSDVDGRYRLEGIPLGRVSISVIATGYETAVIPHIVVGSGKETEVNVTLREMVVNAREVTVEAESIKDRPYNQMATVSARTFSVEEASRYAGSFNDPARMAQSYAGVSSNDDESNEIVIRGNSPRGVLWKAEGVEIPAPSHFSDQGASGGAISMLSARMIANSEFYTSAFPADQGNALSGVFDIRLRRGNSSKREYGMQLGVLGADISLEGPFTKKHHASYLVNYRYSTIALLELINVKPAGNAVPRFQDLSWNMAFPTKKAGVFTFFGISGLSTVNEETPGDTSTNNFRMRNGLLISGLTHTLPIGSKWVVRSALSLNGVGNTFFEETLLPNGDLLYNDWETRFSNVQVRLTSQATWKAGQKHIFRFGTTNAAWYFNNYLKYFDTDDNQYYTQQEVEGWTGSLQAFATWKWRFTNTVSMVSGVHWLCFLLNGQQSLEPRLALEWQVNQRHRFSVGSGLHSRIEDISVYTASTVNSIGQKIFPNQNVGFTRAAHAVIGHDFRITPYMRLKTEVYYQYLFNVPVFADSVSSFSGVNYSSGFTVVPMNNDGTGKNVGAEFTLEHFFHKGLFFLVTASVFDSKYTGSDGIERDTRYNGRFATSVNIGKEWEFSRNDHGNALGVSLRGTWAGGRRYSPILLHDSRLYGAEITDETRAFSLQLPDYLRADFQLYFRRNHKRFASLLKLDIQNVTNRPNVQRRYFSTITNNIEETRQLGIIPVLSYEITF